MAIKGICVFRLFPRIPVEGDNNDLFRAEETCTQRGIRFRLVGGEGSHGRHWGHATYVVSDLLEARKCLHRAGFFPAANSKCLFTDTRNGWSIRLLPLAPTPDSSACRRVLGARNIREFRRILSELSTVGAGSSGCTSRATWRQFLPRLLPGRNASGDSSRKQVRSGSSGPNVARCRPCGTTFHSDPRRNPQLAIPLVVPLDGALLCRLVPFRRLEGI